MLLQMLGFDKRKAATSPNELAWKCPHKGAACVDTPIYPNQSGRVKAAGSWWPARCRDNVVLQQGDTVNIVGIENITLLVVPNA